MKLILIRHGETEANSTDRYWGQADVALNALGLEQARRLAKRLKEEKIDVIYTSTLKRATVTADMMAVGRGAEYYNEPKLNEIDFGEVEGLNFDEITAKFPKLASVWASNGTDVVFPNGESYKSFSKRVSSFKDVLTKYDEDKTVAVVGHGGPFRILICNLLCIDIEHWWKFRFDLASVSILKVQNKGATLELFNGKAHLDEIV